MNSAPEPLDLYTALATVAAITTALQASAALAPVTQVGHLEERHRTASPGSQELSDVKADARKAKKAALWLTVPASLVNGVVLVAWGAVTFRAPWDWVLVAPWGAVAAVSSGLAIVTAQTVLRIRRIHGG